MAYARRPERWPPGFIEAGRPAARIIQLSCARCLLLLLQAEDYSASALPDASLTFAFHCVLISDTTDSGSVM